MTVMEIEPKPQKKKIFDKNDPHFSAPLLVFSLSTAWLHSLFAGFHSSPLDPILAGMIAITFVYLIISLNYPQKPRWLWYLGIGSGALSVCFGVGALNFLF